MIVDIPQIMGNANVDPQLFVADIHVLNGGLLDVPFLFCDRQLKKFIQTVPDILREAEFFRFRKLCQYRLLFFLQKNLGNVGKRLSFPGPDRFFDPVPFPEH